MCINISVSLTLAQAVTMKAILLAGVFAVVALTVAGAPTYSEGEVPQYVSQQQYEDYLRERRSQYAPQFVSPCAAASSMQVPVYAVPPYQGYAVPQYGYTAPHYRSGEEQTEPELLGFSDMNQFMPEHVPMARLGAYGGAPIGGLAPGLSSYGGQVLSQATTGTALGVFPNARVGGCKVPLLFSCSPSIVSGHMVDPHGHFEAGAGSVSALTAGIADSYRLVDEPVHHDVHTQVEEALEHEHLNENPVHETSPVTHQ